jgi:light-regulated signal transduction histidine kinase (bacteriophytochrome)
LRQRYRGKLDADADDFIEFAVDGSRRMKQLINDLLEYSRVGTKKKEFQRIEAADLLKDALKNLEVVIHESGARITHDPLPSLRGDPIQLLSLFQNLIGNAIKFRGDKPPVIHIGVLAEDTHWVFSFKDQGIGIEPDFYERIFVIFQRLHGQGEYPGTGIGLALCRKIVERHGGKIWVESRMGAGSTFFFTIPKTIFETKETQ